MPPTERRWVDRFGYSMAYIDGEWIILAHGGGYLNRRLRDDEMALQRVATARDVDEARLLLMALRATLPSPKAALGGE